MVRHTKNDNLCFRTVYGQNLILDLKKQDGCLLLSLRNDSDLFSYTKGLFLGFAICAITVCKLMLVPFYLALLLLLLLVFILYEMFFSIREERLLVVKGLGYQIHRKFHFRYSTRFIPYEKVQRIFINEVILRHRIIYMLSLIVQEGEKNHKLVPLFKDILPKLDCLERVYRNVKCFENS